LALPASQAAKLIQAIKDAGVQTAAQIGYVTDDCVGIIVE
jgi:hypothetical protein